MDAPFPVYTPEFVCIGGANGALSARPVPIFAHKMPGHSLVRYQKNVN
jgi:hypothetical protein